MTTGPPITLVIRTLDAGPWLDTLLPRLESQRRKPDEFLIVDSGSRDGTVERFLAAGPGIVSRTSPLPVDRRTRSITIPPGGFTHARSTNLGYREAAGEIVVMLSQDALPLDDSWIERLVRPLDVSAGPGSTDIAASFGRQVARPGAFPLERWQIERDYPAASRDAGSGASDGVLFSNVNSAARRSAWLDEPFDETLRIAEDRVWAVRQAARGRRIAYVADAGVLHSHAYTIRNAYARCAAESRARRQAEGVRESSALLFKAWPKQTMSDLRRLGEDGALGAWPRAAVYRLAQFYGMWRGSRDD